MTTPALQAAVRRAHEVFGGRKAPNGHLNVCTSCCMPADLEREMRTLPLSQLMTRHFYGYCDAAMGHMEQPAEEIKYLLPRWLELLATGGETHHSPELALDRLGQCAPGSFDAEETGVLDAFMLGYFDHHLNGGTFWGWSADPLALLIMADAGGRNVQPLLRCWLEHQSPVSTALFVRSTYWDFWPEQRIANPFADSRTQLQAVFKDWMLAPSTKAAFATKLLEPDVLTHGERTHCSHRVPFRLMVDAVFDHLTY